MRVPSHQVAPQVGPPGRPGAPLNDPMPILAPSAAAAISVSDSHSRSLSLSSRVGCSSKPLLARIESGMSFSLFWLFSAVLWVQPGCPLSVARPPLILKDLDEVFSSGRSLLEGLYSRIDEQSSFRLTSDQKMSVCVEEEEDRSESAGSSCLSMKSDRSKELHPVFSNEPGPSDTNFQTVLDKSDIFNNNQQIILVIKKCLHRREEEESCFCGGAAVLLCFVSGRPEGSSLYQLWTLVLQTVHHLILGPVCFIRRLLLSPVWRKIQNKSWTADSQSDQQCTNLTFFSSLSADGGLQEVLDEYKISLKRRCKRVTEGKTFSVQKFTLDWAEGLENQDKVTAEQLAVCKLLFIFDGLDESRLSLDFYNTANQIPPEYVDRLTEVRGFTDAQKEEYFRRRFSDEDLYSRIISHIKTSRTLHIMCQIPVFCWITATVLDHMLTTDQKGELPKTLTDLYSHFLLVQTKRKKQKYDEGHETSPQELMEADREVLLKLGRLAFEHLEKGNIMFYQEDLEQCGLDVTEASVYSGVCTEIFKRECVIFQEFVAAVYLFHCYTNKNTKVLKDFLNEDWRYSRYSSDSSLDVFLRRAMQKSLESKNGHLDLFVRFLHGLSLETNQRLLGGLLGQDRQQSRNHSREPSTT
ncbi:hypothetical protein L3Q82_000139 [Scortum barcoo]|uniref:Uncharacterized protein n=1 Tax=Scortum barcoo TaxID=214431 RepID=A0ACB8XDH0_9TELE|nr:hypothetical protein L3Q82_000139 [Scortum barcoo]